MNIHAPKDAAEFFGQFNFIGKIHEYEGKRYIKVKLKQPMTNRKSYFYSFEYNAIAHSFEDFNHL